MSKKTLVKYIKIIILIILLAIGIYVLHDYYVESNIKFVEDSYNTQLEKRTTKTQEIKITENIETNYLGYEVDCKLIIPKIELETYVFKEYSESGMNICPSKYCGPEPNEIGNYCITGHNYKRENMFKNLKKLEVGDELYLIDNKNGKNAYTIYDIYKVRQGNITPLDQATNENKIITLITCVNYTDDRLIIKAIKNK